VLDWLADHLALIMFGSMFVFIFLGYPVAFIMGGLALIFALVGTWLGVFRLIGISDLFDLLRRYARCHRLVLRHVGPNSHTPRGQPRTP
jgi:TRAP-type mannitol/chloroaromatic compound transport system permease large subunit